MKYKVAYHKVYSHKTKCRIVKASTLKEAVEIFDKIINSEFKTNCIIESIFETGSNKLYTMYDILNLCYKSKYGIENLLI